MNLAEKVELRDAFINPYRSSEQLHIAKWTGVRIMERSCWTCTRCAKLLQFTQLCGRMHGYRQCGHFCM